MFLLDLILFSKFLVFFSLICDFNVHSLYPKAVNWQHILHTRVMVNTENDLRDGWQLTCCLVIQMEAGT